MRILVAEDEPAVRSLIEQVLALEGFEVKACANGGEAMAALHQFKPHLAVLDVMMPVSDGIGVLRAIREGDAPDLPVILLTARADDQSTWNGWRAGCNLYLTKPFDPEDLVSAIRQTIASLR
ncbi:MAG TPA: response regulator transcription factor, partial [Actinomycetota bacterium]|nr:response regulator transcription factor [Actinomycetota bacterium]